MAGTIEDYKKYDFDKNEEFKAFLDEMKPPVPPKAMEFVKRHWYKQNINQSFEPNYDGSLPTFSEKDEQEAGEHFHDGKKCTGHHGHSHSHSSQGASGIANDPQKKKTFTEKLKSIAYETENYLKMVFMISAFWLSAIAHICSVLICFLAIIRQLKRPRFTKEYFLRLSQNQFGQNLLYILAFAFYREQRNVFYFFPLMVHFWIGICEYFNIRRNTLYTKGASLISRTRQNKDRLLLLKSQYEMGLLPALFIQIFFGRSSIFLVLFYYNFLKIKFLISPITQLAFTNLNKACKGIIDRPSVPKFVLFIYNKIEALFCWTVKYESKNKGQEQHPEEASATSDKSSPQTEKSQEESDQKEEEQKSQ